MERSRDLITIFGMRPARPLASPECEQIFVTCSAADGGFSYELDGQAYDADQVPEECR